jgi:hypothetical protein
MIYMYRENRGLFFLSAYIVVVNWLYFGTISGELAWSGGEWGPRYLLPILPFITIVSGTLLQHLKKTDHFKYRKLLLKLSIIILSAAGFFVNLLQTLVWSEYSLMYGAWIWPWLRGLSSTWDPFHTHFVLQIKTLMSGYISHINPEQYVSMPFWRSLHQGLAPCPYDVYIYCKFGITPVLLLSAIITIVAILIMMEISNFNPRIFSALKTGLYVLVAKIVGDKVMRHVIRKSY